MSFVKRLEGLFGSNAVKKALIWGVVVAVGTVVILTQFAFPLNVQYRYAKLYRYSGGAFELNVKSVYEKYLADEGDGAVLYDTQFDMTDSEAYLRIELAFDFNNIGMYKITDIQFTIDGIGSYADRFVFKEANMAEVDRFSKSTVSLFFVMNTQGMTDEEITAAVNSLSVSYTYDRPELFSAGGEIALPQKIALPFDGVIEG